jgi:hypothetical protein
MPGLRPLKPNGAYYKAIIARSRLYLENHAYREPRYSSPVKGGLRRSF